MFFLPFHGLDSGPAAFPFDGDLSFNAAINLAGKGVYIYFVFYFWLTAGLRNQFLETLAIYIDLPNCFGGFFAGALHQNWDDGWGLSCGFCPAGVNGGLVGGWVAIGLGIVIFFILSK